MKKIFLVVFAAMLLLTPVLGQEHEEDVETVILASTENYPDALVSGPASEKVGAPVFLTEEGELPSDTESTIQDFSPEEVVIVGGPEVVSEEVKNQLSQEYEVTRLWGMTRYGTSIEVASYFWPEGAEEAILVQDDMDSENSEIVAEAKQLAASEEAPVFLIPSDEVPANVLAEMQELGVNRTTLVGTQLSSQVRNQVTSMGSSIEEEIGGSTSQVRERLQEEIENRSREKNRTRLLAVAVGGFEDVIQADNYPNSSSYLISSEGEIDELLNFLEGSDMVENVKVVGRPGLASTISSTLENETNLTVELVSGPSSEVASKMAGQHRNEIRSNFARRNRKWKQKIENSESRIRKKMNNTIRKAESMINESSSQEARDALQNALDASESGNYTEAYREAMKARQEARGDRFERIRGNRDRIDEEIEEERQGLQEKVQELTQMNQEFGNEMSQNMTVKERLQIIDEFRGQRRGKVEELVNRASRKGANNGGSGLNRVKESMKDSNAGRQSSNGQGNGSNAAGNGQNNVPPQ